MKSAARDRSRADHSATCPVGAAPATNPRRWPARLELESGIFAVQPVGDEIWVEKCGWSAIYRIDPDAVLRRPMRTRPDDDRAATRGPGLPRRRMCHAVVQRGCATPLCHSDATNVGLIRAILVERDSRLPQPSCRAWIRWRDAGARLPERSNADHTGNCLVGGRRPRDRRPAAQQRSASFPAAASG